MKDNEDVQTNGNLVHRVTMEDVAREAGVSRALVSMVLRGKPGPAAESRELILNTAKALGYRHNAIAARLAARRTNTVGLFLLDLYNEVFADIFAGMRGPIEDAKMKIVLSVGGGPGSDRDDVDSLLNVRVDAAVLAGSLLPDEELLAIASTFPLVSVTRLVPGVDSVATDDRLGGRLAVDHLIQLGHTSILYMVQQVGPGYAHRELGYRDAMRAAGLRPQVVNTAFDFAGGVRDAMQVLSVAEPPTAIFAHNDVIALAVMEAAATCGLRVPEDLSVIGFDDTRVAGFARVGLTTVNQQARRLGELAAEIAIDKAGSESPPGSTAQHRLLEPSLVVRHTTAPPAHLA